MEWIDGWIGDELFTETTGHPQCGHDAASLDTGFEHSRQLSKDT
jgi:hypothetical protein